MTTKNVSRVAKCPLGGERQNLPQVKTGLGECVKATFERALGIKLSHTSRHFY